MVRKLTAHSSSENLKREAKRWLRALAAHDADALARFQRIHPHPPASPGLRDVQHALALEYGFSGWSALKQHLSEATASQHEQRVNTFLELACADPILAHGPAEHARRAHTALRMLQRYPDIAHASIHTAIVCGELDEVQRILSEQPAAAVARGGPLRRRQRRELEQLWTPLLHLCYGRLPLAAAGDNAVAIAELLLDHGADPNDYFEVGSHPSRYSALCGVAGDGEEGAPPHAQREALARLLLERGAEPFDSQLFYNTHFRADLLWYLRLIHQHSVQTGRGSDWEDPEWSMIDVGGYGHGAYYLLRQAIAHNDLVLAEWLLQHGASPNATPPAHPQTWQRPLLEEAQRRGLAEMSHLLIRFGARTGTAPEPNALQEFVTACFQLDRAGALAILAHHPDYLHSTVPMFRAAEQDRADVVSLLLELGTPMEVEDESKLRPLHVAASHNALQVARLLIERGADLEAVESNWNNTPLDFALYANHVEMSALLSAFSNNAFYVVWCGNSERLRGLLAEQPDLAGAVKDGATLLMWLPDDEARAQDIAHLLLERGADASFRNRAGQSAADLAEQRALYSVAALLRAAER